VAREIAFGSAAEVMAYVARRLDAIGEEVKKLKRQPAHRRRQIAVNIEIELARTRWALKYVQGAPPENET
jgi:hypothetical protein